MLLEKLEKIIRLLKPKYYNRITYLIVLTGCSILTKPLWLDILNAILKSANNNINQIQFELIGDWDWLIGLFLIILSLWWNTRNRILDIKKSKPREPEFKNIHQIEYNSSIEVFKTIYPIIKDNEYIFQNVGPNSSSRNTEELRWDLTLWYKYRSEAILPNNEKIKEILTSNISLFSEDELKLVQKMITHIDAFEEHTKNKDFDYSNYKFPVEFQQMIENQCFEEAKKSKHLQRKVSWLLKKLEKLEIANIYIIGSVLIIPEIANDLDIVLLLRKSKIEGQLSLFEELKVDFKLKFKIELHLTIFTSDEKENFQAFIEKNTIKLKTNG